LENTTTDARENKCTDVREKKSIDVTVSDKKLY
jgi:hypothetical protein